jgi:RecB family exonuclease
VASPRALLEECVAEALSGLTTDPFWELERRRWLGEGEGGGLLAAGLAEEGGRLGACVAEEREFSGLRLPGCAFEVCGQIDRLDGEGEGLCCWDYKTGRELASAGAPLVEHPQLAAYGLALRLGLLGEEFRWRPLAGLGYVHLPSEGKVALRRLSPSGGLEAALAGFAAELARLSGTLSGGAYLPAWEACLAAGKREREICPYAALCGLLERLDARPDEEEP